MKGLFKIIAQKKRIAAKKLNKNSHLKKPKKVFGFLLMSVDCGYYSLASGIKVVWWHKYQISRSWTYCTDALEELPECLGENDSNLLNGDVKKYNVIAELINDYLQVVDLDYQEAIDRMRINLTKSMKLRLEREKDRSEKRRDRLSDIAGDILMFRHKNGTW